MTAPVRLPWAHTRLGALVLVNRAHPLPGEQVPDLVPLTGGWPDQHLDRTAARLLTACIRAAGGEGVILPVSGWRSRAEQQAIWNQSLDDNGPTFTAQYVARPGCSEHETGLAVDLALNAEHIDPICPDFPRDGVCGRFRTLAPDYGFIERYTEAKQPLTGIGAEPWHFRYVGVPHARLLVENDLCLEEYTEFLRQGPRTVALPGGRRVTVTWHPCRSAALCWTPPTPCWQVSGDNDGGFITTVWEG